MGDRHSEKRLALLTYCHDWHSGMGSWQYRYLSQQVGRGARIARYRDLSELGQRYYHKLKTQHATE